jgi:hypothetical protein
MLGVIMLSAVMLNVDMLSVVVPVDGIMTEGPLKHKMSFRGGADIRLSGHSSKQRFV